MLPLICISFSGIMIILVSQAPIIKSALDCSLPHHTKLLMKSGSLCLQNLLHICSFFSLRNYHHLVHKFVTLHMAFISVSSTCWNPGLAYILEPTQSFQSYHSLAFFSTPSLYLLGLVYKVFCSLAPIQHPHPAFSCACHMFCHVQSEWNSGDGVGIAQW